LSPAPVLMALIAIRTVIDIPLHATVFRVCLGLSVAIGACEDRVVIRIGVAGGTDSIRSAMGHREPGMVESGAGPPGCDPSRMTCRAGCWKTRGDVIRVRCPLIIGLM